LTTIWRFNLLVAAAAIATFIAGCAPEAAKFRSTDITGAEFGRELALDGHDGKPRTLADFRGKAVLVFFGYTHCPDVCPTTLADAAQALKALGKDADRVQVLFVTVDPERDTPAVLSKYVPAFDPRFLGLHGDAAAIQKAAKEFKIFYEKRAGKNPGEYTMDHSGQSYVFDPQGRIRLLLRHDRLSQDLAEDLRTLLKD
jgi:protein SCO1/2